MAIRRYTGVNELSLNEFIHHLGSSIKIGDFAEGITLHHTWKPTAKGWKGMRTLDVLARFYSGKGWSAGPHFFVTPEAWYVLSPPTHRGVHAKAFNKRFIGVEVVHNGDDSPFEGQIAKTTFGGLNALFKHCNWDPKKRMNFHRDDPRAYKSCPGRKVSKADVLMGILNADKGQHDPKVEIERHFEDGDDIPIYVNDKLISFHGERIDAVTYVPLRDAARAMGGDVKYWVDSKGRHLALVKEQTRIDLTGEVEIEKGRAWSSIRPLAEDLGYRCIWDGALRAVRLEAK